MDILAYKKTLTTQFLMPLLFENKKFTEILPDFESFVDAYIADFDKPNYDNKIILVFKKKQKTLPEVNMIDKYTKEIKDKELYFYVYDLPLQYWEDYTLLLLGKYSHFSDEAKKTILNFWEEDEFTLQYGVLYKTGKTIKDFYKKHFEIVLNEKKGKNNEWWLEPRLNEEIYGAE